MVRAFAHRPMGRRIDGGPIVLFLVPTTTGVAKAVVYAIMSVGWRISETYGGGKDFLFRYLIAPLLYVRRHITVLKMC